VRLIWVIVRREAMSYAEQCSRSLRRHTGHSSCAPSRTSANAVARLYRTEGCYVLCHTSVTARAVPSGSLPFDIATWVFPSLDILTSIRTENGGELLNFQLNLKFRLSSLVMDTGLFRPASGHRTFGLIYRTREFSVIHFPRAIGNISDVS
jgi:hypothetical protein